MKTLLSTLFLLLCSLTTLAQTPYCGTDEIHLQRMATDPNYAEQFEQAQQAILQYSQAYYDPHNHSQNNNGRDVAILPVVVHIVSPPGTPIGSGNNITDIEVQQGLQYLNEAFANTGNFVAPNGVDTEIQFCLAQRDPLGLPTTGIIRHESSLVADPACAPNGFDMDNTDPLLDIAYWDCCQYINIYLVTDIFSLGYGCSASGYSTLALPCTSKPYFIQESRYWISLENVLITAHEMGHYLGLYHTWQNGCANNNCLSDGDMVCDTPPDSEPFNNCIANTCNTDSDDTSSNNPLMIDVLDDAGNIMDYSTCTPYHFTEGQKVRMHATINVVNICLLSSMACQPAAPTNVPLVTNLGNSSIRVFQDILVINHRQVLKNPLFKIYNPSSQLLLQIALAESQVNEIPIQDLPAGIYIAHLQTTSGMQAFKFVKN